MYYVAKVNADMCAEYKCNTCTLYCPEANTLMFDKVGNTSWVDEDRCKGCALCVYVCTDMLSRNCITMEMVHGKEE
ncbi:MAG: ferredoxin oxidoreductase [Sulfuricurvum sp. 17-40-25]|nr:MAG: ferredoxin oxidoreductase [Campylobacterales bacterium 16-40-21]OZA03979.1 MAG: ferredoxin oxidoreductase [Sulfuricurvum sp. 17-40-25]